MATAVSQPRCVQLTCAQKSRWMADRTAPMLALDGKVVLLEECQTGLVYQHRIRNKRVGQALLAVCVGQSVLEDSRTIRRWHDNLLARRAAVDEQQQDENGTAALDDWIGQFGGSWWRVETGLTGVDSLNADR